MSNNQRSGPTDEDIRVAAEQLVYAADVHDALVDATLNVYRNALPRKTARSGTVVQPIGTQRVAGLWTDLRPSEIERAADLIWDATEDAMDLARDAIIRAVESALRQFRDEFPVFRGCRGRTRSHFAEPGDSIPWITETPSLDQQTSQLTRRGYPTSDGAAGRASWPRPSGR